MASKGVFMQGFLKLILSVTLLMLCFSCASLKNAQESKAERENEVTSLEEKHAHWREHRGGSFK